jgi:DNA-binding MarR family transcriptional regulator
MPTPNEIQLVNAQIRGMEIPRIIAFADVVNRFVQKILKNDVSWLRASALIFLITRGGTLAPGQLARIMLRSNYSITKLVDGLEEDRLVKRYPDGKDRRSIRVQVTSEGLDYVISNLGNLAETERELKCWIDDEELENLAATIRKLRDKLIEKVSERYGLNADDRNAIFRNAPSPSVVQHSQENTQKIFYRR